MLTAILKSTAAPRWALRFKPSHADVAAIAVQIRRKIQQLASSSDDGIRSLAQQIAEQNSSLRANQSNSGSPITRRTIKLASCDLQIVAVVSEAARRTLGFQMYDCQLAATWIVASGKLIEMHTGEGKTLVCGAAAAVAALSGSATHVATTNAYLASRDYQVMQPMFQFLGITSSQLPSQHAPSQHAPSQHAPSQHAPSQSRAAYQQQIVYGPGYQFGFDYLFDQLTRQRFQLGSLGAETLSSIHGLDLSQELVQTDNFETTIIDEADSVLIDEALTPLILSAGASDSPEPIPFRAAHRFVEQLLENSDYLIDRQRLVISLTPIGLEKSTAYRNNLDSTRLRRTWTSYVHHALRAKHLLHRNKDYVVTDAKVKVVDPLTGRIFEDRTWQAGLHQAIEVKEGVEVTQPRQSQVRITRQTFINKYGQLCGMSGTLLDTADELKQTYGVSVVSIPTHRPCRRTILPPRFFASWEAKSHAIAIDVKKRHDSGQPILIGTNSIQKSLLLAQVLDSAGLQPIVLNGLQDQSEAEIVAHAGQPGQITIATNMAGRGTDIKLGDQSPARGGLHVIGTEPNPCRRVDRQLIGRSARQGQIGSAQFFISADDDLITKRGPRVAQSIIRACRRTSEARSDFSPAIVDLQIQEERCQTESRRLMVNNERWLDQVRETVFGK
jgi:preprotein translocase subunit SecA